MRGNRNFKIFEWFKYKNNNILFLLYICNRIKKLIIINQYLSIIIDIIKNIYMYVMNYIKD